MNILVNKSKTMFTSIKENLDGIVVSLAGGGVTAYSIIEKATPVLTFVALISTITVGIFTVINLIKRNRQLDKQNRIDDMILDSERKSE